MGLPLRRRRLHGVLEPADQRRAGVHPQRLRGAGVHHVEVQGRPGRRDRRRHAGRRAAADARRHDRRLRAATRPPSPRSRPSRSTRPHRRHRHALLVGHDRAPEGRHPRRSCATPLDDRAGVGRRRCCSCCSASTTTSVYLSPAPLYHAAPLRFCMAAQALGGTVVVDGALRRRAVPRARRALPRHPQPGRADDVRAHAEAARRGARASTTCRRCSASSTPPRRARCRSSSR